MHGDPYSELARQETPNESVIIRLGTVLTVSPLSISVGKLPIEAENLRVNASLLPTPMETDFTFEDGEAQGTIKMEETFEAGFTFESGEATGTIRLKEPLKPGDRVLLYSEDDQVFYIICKVVTP